MHDVFTRKGYARPLKSKSKSSVTYGFTTTFEDLNMPVRLILTDSGREFMNRDLQDLFKQLKIRDTALEGFKQNIFQIDNTVRKRLPSFHVRCQQGEKKILCC